jgi:hypothetical protein
MPKKFAFLLATACLIAPHANAATVRTLEEELRLETGEILDLDLPVGELKLRSTSDSTVEMVVEIECKRSRRRCESAAEDLELRTRKRGDTLRVDLDGWPSWGTSGLSVKVTVAVPEGHPVVVDMGVGKVDIRGLKSDLTIDLGIGDVEVEMDAEFVQSVSLDSGIGESSVAFDGQHISGKRSFLGDEVRWSEGEGNARIRIDLGIGAIDVDLD